MNILLISQYANELINNTVPDNPILLIHYTNYHKKIYQTLMDLGHNVFVSDGINNEELLRYVELSDLIFPICNDFGYPNGDILIRLLSQKYKKRIVGGSSFSKFYESDKIAGKLLSDRLNVKTPHYVLYYQLNDLNFEGPYIIKPRFTGSSLNLSDKNIFTDKQSLLDFVKEIWNPECYYIEKFIEGITLTIGCLKGADGNIIIGEPYSISSLTHKVITYEDKRNCGCIRKPVKNITIHNTMIKYCKLFFNALQPCQIARFDFMLSKDEELYFLEINETPNLSETGGFVQLMVKNHFGTYKNLISHLLQTSISSNK